jgi:Plavaka transposase
MDYEDLDQPVAERRTRRLNRRLPTRYRDIAPEPPAPLPPLSSQPERPEADSATSHSPAHQCSVQAQVWPVRRILKSLGNIFGLYRQYYAIRFPDHDPAENITPSDLTDTSPTLSSGPPARIYYPYPNQSSFLLGEWYWNDGERKSQSSFQNLLNTVGHPAFRPEDVAGKNWRAIDAQLSGGHSKVSNLEDDWGDAQDSRPSSWIKTPIKINVPFHKRMQHPGQKWFNAGTLHHRQLTSLIREKITRATSHAHLHFEPYELFWQPNESAEPVRVHGELFTSEAFIQAHRELQDSPGEPGCDLPRVVLGLMFASDGTQLTSFSTAKLWPVYLMVGNESKARRVKPSCHAFEHVAYLETVHESLC